MNNQVIICLDTETTGLDPKIHEVIEIYAVALDPASLTAVTGGVFHSLIRPSDFTSIDEKAMQVNGISLEELKTSPKQKYVWKKFASWVKEHNKGKSKTEYTAPIVAGKNVAFDLGFIKEAANKYLQGTTLFRERPVLELENFLYLWFENDSSWESYGLDSCRKAFGIESKGSHRAAKDVIDTVRIFRAFFRLHRMLKSSELVDFTSADFCKDAADDCLRY